MLRNRNIVMFGDDWGRHASTPQHLAKYLLRDNKILWINSFGTRRPRASRNDVRRIVAKVQQWRQGSSASVDVAGLTTVQPMLFPFYDQTAFRWLNDRLLLRQIRRALRDLEMDDPVLITGHPLMADLVGSLGETSSHYLCLDDYTRLPNVYACLGPLEEMILTKVTAVFSVSASLQESRRPKTGESHFLPQGVDTDHFRNRPDSRPDALRHITGPIVGFHGLLSDWVDVELIANAARAYPRVSFVIVGRAVTDITVLSSQSNVVVVGHVPYESLPPYASTFDVGLIPFKINDLTLACNPLKTLEYLALGMPVVATDLPEVRRFVPYVSVADDREEFIQLIGTALAQSADTEARGARRAKAEQYSWSSIASHMSGTMERLDADAQRRNQSGGR